MKPVLLPAYVRSDQESLEEALAAVATAEFRLGLVRRTFPGDRVKAAEAEIWLYVAQVALRTLEGRSVPPAAPLIPLPGRRASAA
jgi:hypothetical protein